jgi:1-deoxy-D-xylulose-5-phosphate reductoisomerase
MGPRVTVDSATLMNKGFEVIEARWLYDIEEPRIRVIVQPSSVVHSLIELVDGSMHAQMAVPDMRIPIQYALSYPERWPSPALRLQLPERPVIFEDPRLADFPALELAREALRRGGVVPACLNAADEVAVQSFLAGQISFTNIVEIVLSCVNNHVLFVKIIIFHSFYIQFRIHVRIDESLILLVQLSYLFQQRLSNQVVDPSNWIGPSLFVILL